MMKPSFFDVEEWLSRLSGLGDQLKASSLAGGKSTHGPKRREKVTWTIINQNTITLKSGNRSSKNGS